MVGSTKAVCLCVLLIAAAGTACREPSGPAGPARAVILITLDTARGDEFDWNDPARLPELKRFFGTGKRFEQAVTVAPVTGPAHASMFTGLPPTAHGVLVNGMTLPEERNTLAERFRALGFRTAGFVSCSLLGREFGFAQGFEHFDDELERSYSGRAQERTADSTTERALDWLRRNDDAPFFLWLHYFDAHAPYDPPAAHRPTGFDDLERDGGIAPTVERLADIHRFDVQVPDRIRDYYRALYRGELAFVDEQLGRLFRYLEEQPYFDDIVVALAGDHGEELGDHRNFYEHNRSLYDGVMRVPYAVRSRAVENERVGFQVSNGSVAATLLEALGETVPGDLMSGVFRTTGPLNEAAARSCIKEPIPMLRPWGVALRQPPWKLIWWEHGERELYDLSKDPGETRNLATEQPDTAARLQAVLEDEVIGRIGSAEFRQKFGEEPDEATLEILRSLGYVD